MSRPWRKVSMLDFCKVADSVEFLSTDIFNRAPRIQVWIFAGHILSSQMI